MSPGAPMSSAGVTGHADVGADARSLVQEAEHLIGQGRSAEAAELATRALAHARQCGDLHLQGRASAALSVLNYDSGHYLFAYASAREAYRLFGECGEANRQLVALVVCANVYMYSDDIAGRVELLRQGLPLSVGADHAAVRCLLLRNLADGLWNSGEHAEAIECMNEAIGIAQQLPQRQGLRASLASQLANIHLMYADHLGLHGSPQAAQAQLAAARRTLPPRPAESSRAISRETCQGLWSQLEVLASLGQEHEARWAAAACIRFARRSKEGLITLGQSLTFLSKMYRRQGHWQQSIRCEHRVLATWRAANYEIEVITCLRRLSELHAITGAHDRALALRKELAARQGRRRHEAAALRCRLAAVERQAERRRRQAQEALAHARRLAIIGRLIAQTHHALSAPIAQARRLAVQALACAANPDVLRPLLIELSEIIDRAAALVSQLKLFSYRSSPEAMALSLHEALLDAWRGLEPHIGSRRADLQIGGHKHLQVWGDAQRLGIMLKVLLIELTQQPCTAGAPVSINAQIEAGEADTVLLQIGACSGPMASNAAAAAPSLGAALCMEIAAEMEGELRPARGDAAVLHYRLHLPRPAKHMDDLPPAPVHRTSQSVGLS
jgi:tetratricopeptide (TPR) repeat protein